MIHLSSDSFLTENILKDIQDSRRRYEESVRNQMRDQDDRDYLDSVRHFAALLEKQVAEHHLVEERAAVYQAAQEVYLENAETVVSHSPVKETNEYPPEPEKGSQDTSATPQDNASFRETQRLSEREKREERMENEENDIVRRKTPKKQQQKKQQKTSLANFLQPSAILINQPPPSTLPDAEFQQSPKIAKATSDFQQSLNIATATSGHAQEKNQKHPDSMGGNTERKTNSTPGRASQASDLSPGKSRGKQIASKLATAASHPHWNAGRTLVENRDQKRPSIRKNTNISRSSTKQAKNRDNEKEDRADKKENVIPNLLRTQFNDNLALSRNNNAALSQTTLNTSSLPGKNPGEDSKMLAEKLMMNFFQDPDKTVHQLRAAGEEGKSIRLRVDKLEGTIMTLSTQAQGGVLLNIHPQTQAAYAIIVQHIDTMRKFFFDNLPFRPLKLKVSFAPENKRSSPKGDEEAVAMNADALATGSHKSETGPLSDNMA